jgi:uncharacterized protein with von Willebrand factor type A (vWA) domain
MVGIIAGILTTAASIAALWLLRRIWQKESPEQKQEREKQEERDSEQEQRERERQAREQRAERERAEQERQAAEQAAERARRAREDEIQKLLNANPDLVPHMLQRAGLGHKAHPRTVVDSQLVKEVAERLPELELEVFRLAAAQDHLKFDLQTSRELVAVNYPTSNIEVEPMSSYDQLSELLPEQLLMTNDQFYHALAEQHLLILQHYEQIVKQKLLYMLLDVSGSMERPMANGMPRHVWARGVTLNLLRKALHGEAQYYMRMFDGGTYDLYQSLNADEAARLIDLVLNLSFRGEGTNIFGALQRACTDIRERSTVQEAELLLITDGEDGVKYSVEKVKELLGDDIRLHIAFIGTQSEVLQQAAHSCHKFDYRR